jgi:hypothetical protein
MDYNKLQKKENCLNLNSKLFVNFPNPKRFFFKDDFINATKIEDDLYLNGHYNCVEIKPNQFFDNFSSEKQIKQFQNMFEYESIKLPNIFYTNNLLVKPASSEKYEPYKNYPEIFDFLIFNFKLFDNLTDQQCFCSFLEFLKNSPSQECMNEKILNNLKHIDYSLDQRLFALIIYFTTYKYYYTKKLHVKWGLVFETKKKENYYLTMQNL